MTIKENLIQAVKRAVELMKKTSPYNLVRMFEFCMYMGRLGQFYLGYSTGDPSMKKLLKIVSSVERKNVN